MTDAYDTALELAGELLGRPLELPLGQAEGEGGRSAAAHEVPAWHP